MVISIAAIDNKLGIANDQGIPWQGKIPTDVKHFRKATIGQTIIMGYGMYQELSHPFPDRRNIVATTRQLAEPIKPGFEVVSDVRKFISEAKGDIWIVGGAKLYQSLLDITDKLDLTLIEADFNCTKFFPEFKDKFELTSESEPITENGLTYRFTIWNKKKR
jgi:dihydrofolate reductase